MRGGRGLVSSYFTKRKVHCTWLHTRNTTLQDRRERRERRKERLE